VTLSVENGVRTRAYDPCDYNDVARLLEAEGWLHALPTLADVDMYGTAYVALKDSEIVGFVRALSDGYAVTYIAEIVVEPRYRGQGIGKELLLAVQLTYPTSRVDLLASEPAKGFYERVGYTAKPGYRRWPQ